MFVPVRDMLDGLELIYENFPPVFSDPLCYPQLFSLISFTFFNCWNLQGSWMMLRIPDFETWCITVALLELLAAQECGAEHLEKEMCKRKSPLSVRIWKEKHGKLIGLLRMWGYSLSNMFFFLATTDCFHRRANIFSTCLMLFIFLFFLAKVKM